MAHPSRVSIVVMSGWCHMLLVVGRHWSPTWTATSMYPTLENWWWDSVGKKIEILRNPYNNHKSELHM